MVLTVCLLALGVIGTGSATKFIVPPCDQHMFDSNVDICRSEFNSSMEMSGYQERCPWPTVKGFYNKLKSCVDTGAKVSWCKGHRFLVDDVFLGIHRTYFSLCGQVRDPPLITLMLLITPCVIVTLFMPLLCAHLTSKTEQCHNSGL